MNSLEITEFKMSVIRHLLADEQVVELLDPNHEFEYPDDLIYERIFPFGRIPDTEQEVKTYITVMIDVPNIAKNDITRDVNITIRALTYESLMRVKGSNGTRIDLLSERIDKLLNESYDFGIGYITMVHNKEFVLDSKHFYRELKFKTLDLNSRRYGA